MKKLLKYTSPVLLILFLFAGLGCEKDANLSDEDLLTSHVWRFSEMTANTDNADALAWIEVIEALVTGMTLNLHEGGTYTMTVMQQSEDGTWELSADGTTLTLDKGTADESETTLVSLTLTKMVWEDEGSYLDEIFTTTTVWIK